MADTAVIGGAISQLRRAMNLTQQMLAARLYVSHQAVSKWEHGVALPDIMTLYSMCRLFGITMEQLITNDISDRLSAMRVGAAC